MMAQLAHAQCFNSDDADGRNLSFDFKRLPFKSDCCVDLQPSQISRFAQRTLV
jgi:hypothetical protein